MLNKLVKITVPQEKRKGRGIGSGVGGHTVGRGGKGHTARQGGKTPLWFEGGQLPLIKRLPYLRGKFHNKTLNPTPVTITIERLKVLEGKEVTIENLIAAKLLRSKSETAKIVSGGDVPKIKEIRGVAVSNKAKAILEKAGVDIK
ncbi:MAG TPA: 50S ribosomal protein L15 [Patescibacteria group bacterium]|nr:50S ribosomal protein L15 [Patescibacteria group bacterium]